MRLLPSISRLQSLICGLGVIDATKLVNRTEKSSIFICMES